MLTDPTAVVVREIRALLAEIERDPVELDRSDRLDDIGLDSLRLARLMIALETELGVDPFGEEAAEAAGTEPVDVFDVHTVGELVDAYAGALERTAVGAAG
jgi:acyl carrier protein